MKQTTHVEPRHVYDKQPIPHNHTEPAMPSAVREFAELLAEIAVRQLRLKQNIHQGDLPNV
jgi:hypothetical protein